MENSDAPSFVLTEGRFYRFVREERLFCGTLAHLLLQRGRNLGAFLELVNAKLPGSPFGTSRLEEAEVYPEFTFLRDHWNGLGRDNAAKRAHILELLQRAGGLAAQIKDDLPEGVPQPPSGVRTSTCAAPELATYR